MTILGTEVEANWFLPADAEGELDMVAVHFFNPNGVVRLDQISSYHSEISLRKPS